MERKKKYLGGLKALLLLLFIMSLSTFSTCYAYNNVTPINQMDENIAMSIFDTVYQKNQFGLYSNSDNVYYHNFYSHLTRSTIQSFVNKWNNVDWNSLDVDYIENCLIVPWVFIDGNNIHYYVFDVLFDNSGLGNKSNFIRINQNNTYYYHYYIDTDNNNAVVSGNNLVFYIYDTGEISDLGIRPIPADPGFYVKRFGSITTSSGIINLPMAYSMRYSAEILYSSNWYLTSREHVIPFNIYWNNSDDSNNGSIGDTGNITNPSGETTASINLSGIEQGLSNIQNQISGDSQRIIDNQNQNTQTIVNTISGEVSKITNTLTNQPNLNDTTINSGDIESALGFNFMADPYSNFWFEMTNGLRSSLTGSVRQLPINWLGYQGVLDLDNLGFNYPASVRLILTSASTVSMVWLLVKWWKIIVDKLTSGDMDEVLAMNEEERHCRFILKGAQQ